MAFSAIQEMQMTHHSATEPTIIASWIRVILKTYASYGLDPDALLEIAGIEKECLANPEARVRIAVYDRLWRLAVERTGDDCMGLKTIGFLSPMTFHALGLTLLAGATIRESLDRLQRYYRIISDEVRVKVLPGRQTTALCFIPFSDRPVPANASVDAFMAVSIMYARMLASESLNPEAVWFMHHSPGRLAPFTDLFKAPIVFSAEDNRIYFHNADLERPLPAANAEIAVKNDEIAAGYLARFEKARIEDQVRAKTLSCLASGEPSLEKIARSVGMSPRTLNRQLSERGTSYREILLSVRRELALLYLRQEDLAIIDIAFRLGYGDSSNFTRAFKQWFGMSPSLYRKEQSQTSPSCPY